MKSGPWAETGGGFPRPVWFWAGVAAGTAGTVLHLPMFLHARHMGYRMAGMAPDPAMVAGMALIVCGVGAVLVGLWPPRAEALRREAAAVRVRADDDAGLRPAHVMLLIVLSLAVTIDVMKPLTLSLVVPGVAAEYGLASPLRPGGAVSVAWLPLAGISGTMVGSFVWAGLGDRIGRRNSILLAGVLFATTSVCGAMPGFWWNVLMCFVMGMAAGGMIPIAFTLMAETVPRRHRGWLMVLIGGNVTVAYALTSWLAAVLTPEFGWRALWLVGLPTGLLLLVLNHWIPESPRFLLATGREEQARELLRRYGSTVVSPVSGPVPVSGSAPALVSGAGPGDAPGDAPGSGAGSALLSGSAHGSAHGPGSGPGPVPPGDVPGHLRLWGRGFGSRTAVLTLLATGAGLLTYGFQMWLPVNLGRVGYLEASSARILRDSALISLPLNVLTALLYGLWSSRRTAVVVAGSAAGALVVLAVAGETVAGDESLMRLLLFVPLWGISATAAVVAAYSSEVYPTALRSRGTGWAAGVSKAGGVLVLALAVGTAAVPPMEVTALVAAVPLALAAVAFVFLAPETRGRRLDES
ncbi:MFS transporter [Streptomyces gobitricini]|uniref:MFS transporter n=1 Tax=Streptomyces gobitricini TaxID=68211 RepID=UPI0031DDB489